MKAWLCGVLAFLLLMGGAAVAETAPFGWDFVYDGEWLYYGSPPGDGSETERQLVRYRPSDGARETIAQGGSGFYQLCVLDGRVFAPAFEERGVLRVNADGSKSAMFCEGITMRVYGADGQLFVLKMGLGEVRFDRYDPQTGQLLGSVPLGEGGDNYVFQDGWIYYESYDPALRTEYRNEGFRFCRVRQDGTAAESWHTPDSPLEVSGWTVWNGRLYYGLVNRREGKAELRSVALDGTGEALISEQPVLFSRIWNGWAYGAPLEFDEEFRNYDGGRSTVRVSLQDGTRELVGDFPPYALHPAGEYAVVMALNEDDSWQQPLLMCPDGSGARPLLD